MELFLAAHLSLGIHRKPGHYSLVLLTKTDSNCWSKHIESHSYLTVIQRGKYKKSIIPETDLHDAE
ncbi:hypothetical protein, partial [Pseudomonas syringae]|uniref:hypothetical protein n=1 Tax=Pseudomonas syringae TaxID=317 RepID=UPI0034D72107